jgi:tripartite-type tricarboxylate transporter receptor subunit TctC
VQRLNSAFNNVQSNPAVVARLTGMGFELVGGSPEAFRQYMAADVGKWKKVAKDYNITAE